MRILQHLNHYQHFVETDTMYSLDDLIKLINGKLLADIETIVGLFTAHITEQCEICHGNAFFCELCSDNEVISPTNLFNKFLIFSGYSRSARMSPFVRGVLPCITVHVLTVQAGDVQGAHGEEQGKKRF